MSVSVSTWVWENSTERGTALLALLALADMANDEGSCWPSVASLERRLRLHRRQVQSLLRGLETRGAVATDSRSGRSSVYRIVMSTEGVRPAAQVQSTARAQRIAQRGAVDRAGGAQRTAPRTVKEPSGNQKEQPADKSAWLPVELAISESYGGIATRKQTGDVTADVGKVLRVLGKHAHDDPAAAEQLWRDYWRQVEPKYAPSLAKAHERVGVWLASRNGSSVMRF